MKLDQILQENFQLPAEELEEARRLRAEKGGTLGEILIQKKLVTEHQLLQALSIQYEIPYMNQLPANAATDELVEKVPIQFLKKYLMVPLSANGGASLIPKNDEGTGRSSPPANHLLAIHHPACHQPLDDLIKMLNLSDVQVVLAPKEEILRAINQIYDHNRQDSAEQLVQDMEDDGTRIISEIEETADLLDDTSDAPIIKLVNHLISRAVKARASDIHIESFQNSFKVRYRIDGILYDFLAPPKWIQPAVISRIKVMARLNIAEKRLPQDGRFEVRIGQQNIDIRVSIIPTAFGERVVLRLLDKTGSLLRLTDIGLGARELDSLKRLIHAPNGIILVTGPTGSGKTTTLYAILSSINSPDINIITIEDPIEYQISGIGQIQVNRKIGLTFARGLRSIVRQDPDVILIGEIRDQETAEIAVQSAMTGHLVFSTLHTNDSASAVTRLVDIGVEPFLISSSLIAVIAQRLVRVLCPDCRVRHTPDEVTLKRLGLSTQDMPPGGIFKSQGCSGCFETGYRGRIGIFETLVLNDRLKSMILKTFDSNRIKGEAITQGMVTLRQDGIQKILDGKTSLEEVLRVTH